MNKDNYCSSAKNFVEAYMKLYTLEGIKKETLPHVRAIVKLYRNVKGIFLNSFELMNFPDLGQYFNALKVHYVGGILLNRHIKKEQNNQKSQVIMSIADCNKLLNEDNLEIWESFKEAFIQVLGDKINLIYDCNLEENEKQYLLNNKRDLIIESRKIKNMQNELAKGNTLLLITNCSGNQVFEAIYENVQLLCLPYSDDQFFISEALKIDHSMLEKFKKRVDSLKSQLNYHEEVSQDKVCDENIIAPSLRFKDINSGITSIDHIKKVFDELLKEDSLCKIYMKAAQGYLHYKLEGNYRENFLIKTVLKVFGNDGDKTKKL